jgi:hypothetical protein
VSTPFIDRGWRPHQPKFRGNLLYRFALPAADVPNVSARVLGLHSLVREKMTAKLVPNQHHGIVNHHYVRAERLVFDGGADFGGGKYRKARQTGQARSERRLTTPAGTPDNDGIASGRETLPSRSGLLLRNDQRAPYSTGRQ